MAENDPFSTQPTSVDTLDQLQTQQAVNKFEDLSRSPLPQEINQATDTRVFGEDLSHTKAYQQEQGLVFSMLKDPANLGGMANDTVKKSNSYADPQAFRDMAVNMRALSFLTGAPIDEVSEGYDRFKKGFAAQMGWQPTKSDSDFRSKLQAHFEQEDARKQAVTNLQNKAVQDAVSFADQGMGRNPLSAFSEWQQNEYAGLKGIPEAQQLQIFNQVYLPVQQQMNTPEGALAKEIVDTFHKGNEITRPVAESATGLIDKLSGYSDEQRKQVYALANTYAQTLAPTASINNPLWNMGQSLLRTTGNMSASISTAAQRVYTAAQIKDAEHGGAQGEINEVNGLPSTPDTQGIEAGQQKIKNLSIAAELRQASQGMNDLPLGYGLPGIINKSISSALNATPYIAAFAADPIVGVGLMYGSTVADQQQRILANNPNMSIGKATLMAEAYAAPMSALMSISLPGVSGIFPAVERTLAQFAAEGTAANYAAHVAIGTAGMDFSSLSQIAGDAISQAIDKDFNPGASVKEQLIELWKSQPELLGSMMFLSAIGAGKTYHDTDQVAALAKVVGDTKTLKKYGFSDEQISKIQSTPLNEVQGVIAEEAGKRTPENIASGISQARKDGQATKDAAESHETPTLTTTDDGTHVIMAPDGNGGMQEVYRTKDQDAAMQALAMAYKAHDEGQLKTLHETIRYFEQADKEQRVEGRTYETKLTPDKEKVTFQDMLEQGIPLEQLKERMRIAGIHEDTALSDVVVDGMTKGDQYQDVIRVLNSNPRTAIHERLDATTTRALDSGKVSDEQMTKWIRQTEEATGHKYLSSETPTRQEIIEAVTSIGEEYAAGHFANREAAPSALKGYFKAMVRYFNNILSRAKVLHNGIKEGKIDANFEQHLAEGIGLPITERLAPAEAKAKAELMGEKVADAGLEQGTLFSIRKASETALAKSEEFKKSADAAEDEFWQNVWPKALKEAGYTLKASLKNLKTAAEKSLPHILEWLKENPQYIDYYHKDWELTKAHLQDAIPGFNDEDLHAFRLFTGITSPNTLLAGNLKDAVQLINLWKKEGSIKSMKWEWSAKGNRKVGEGNPFTLESTTGAGKIFAAHALEDFYSKLGSWKAVNDFLHEGVTTKELNEVNREAGYKGSVGDIGKIREVVMQATGQDELIPRMFIFGPKVGAYTLNTTGDDRFTTTDIWEARFIRSHFPEMFKDGTGLPVNVDEHEIFQKFANSFNELFQQETGLDLPPSALQAVRWFYMIDSAKRAGYRYAKTDGSISDYTKQAIKSKLGIDLGSDSSRRGQGNGADSQGNQEQGKGNSVAFSIRDRDEAGNRKAISRQWGSFPKGTEVEVIGERSKDPLDTNLLVRFPDGTEEKFPMDWLKTPKGQMTAPKESLPQLVNRLGRDGVNDLLAEWNDAELSPDGNFIMGVVDPRSSMKLERIPVREFLDWVQENNSNKDSNTSFSIRARDEAYDAAVKSGDEAEQQRLVDEAIPKREVQVLLRDQFHHGDQNDYDEAVELWRERQDAVSGKYPDTIIVKFKDIPSGLSWLIEENAGADFDPNELLKLTWKDAGKSEGQDSPMIKVQFSDTDYENTKPIVYNDAGNVIPLSQRFNPDSNDIRFSISTRADQERVQQELEKRIASSPTARTRIFENAAKRFEAITARQDKVMEAFAEGKASSAEVIRKDMESNLVELNAIMSALPAEVRASLTRNWRNPGTGEGGNIYTKYASLGSDKAKADFLIKTIQKASDLIDHQLRAEYVDRAYRLYDAAQPKNERGTGPKGKLGAEGHAIVNEVGSLWHMTAAEVSNYIKTRQAEMDTIDSGDSPLSSEDSITRRQELFNEILLAQIHGNFSPWDSKGKLKGQDNPDMNAEQSALALESLQGIIREGRYDWNQQLVARRDWVKSEQQKAIEAINGKEATTSEINQSKEKDAGILAGIDAYLDTHFTRAQLLDHILGQEQAAYWKRRIYDAANAEHDRNHATDIRDTRSLLQAIFGADTKDSVVNRTKLQMALSKLSGRKDTGIEVEENRKFQKNKIERITAEGYVQNPSTWKGSSADLEYMARTLAGLKSTSRVKYLEVREQVPDSGEKVKLHLSEMEAIQRLLSWRQADARPSLEYSGMTQEVADKLEAFVNKTAAGRAYYDYLKKAYDNYDEINAKFKEVFGVDMPRVKNYATLVWDTSKSQDKAKDLDGEHGGGASMTPSFGISRQNHAAKIRDENAWLVYQAHMRQVNYWLTHVDLNRDMRAILGNADVLRAAQAKKVSYRDALKEISGFIGKEKASAGELLGMNGEIAREAANYLGTSVLGYNAKVTLKHLIPSMSSSMMLAPDEFVGSLTRVLTGQAIKPVWGKDGMINSREVLRFLEASHSNNDREAIKAGSKPAPIRNAILAGKAIGEVGHSWIPAFVHQANAISSAIAYDASYHSAIKEGLTEAQAHEVARAKTDEILHQTNPVGFGIDRPAGEAGNALMRFLANFAGPVRQRFGIVAHEVKTTPRDLREANGVGEKAKVIGDKAWKLSTAWVLSGVMEAAILQGFAALAGSQQEKEDANSLSEYLAAAVAGPTYGIYWLGAGLSGLIKDKITGKHAFLTTGNPLLDKFTGAYRSAKKVITKPAQAEAEDYISTGKAAIDAVAMMFLFARQYGIAKALGGISAMGNVAKTGTHAARNAGIMDQSTKPVKHNRGILD
jgi:hypothetical protein